MITRRHWARQVLETVSLELAALTRAGAIHRGDRAITVLAAQQGSIYPHVVAVMAGTAEQLLPVYLVRRSTRQRTLISHAATAAWTHANTNVLIMQSSSFVRSTLPRSATNSSAFIGHVPTLAPPLFDAQSLNYIPGKPVWHCRSAADQLHNSDHLADGTKARELFAEPISFVAAGYPFYPWRHDTRDDAPNRAF